MIIALSAIRLHFGVSSSAEKIGPKEDLEQYPLFMCRWQLYALQGINSKRRRLKTFSRPQKRGKKDVPLNHNL